MHDTIGSATRMQIAAFLPAAIEKGLESYHRFSARAAPDDAKEFAAHHNACKVAIAHVELLLKLARWADIDESEPADDLTRMLTQAEEEVRRYHDGDDA